MAVRLRLAGALVLTALSVALTGAAVPANANTTTAPTPPAASITAQADPPSGWVTTTDPVSGISVMLPGQPTVKNTTTTDANGETLPLRQYLLEFDGGNRAVLFQVIDATFRQVDFDKALQGAASAQSDGTVTDGTVTNSRHFVLDGRPAADGRITATVAGTPAVYLVRLVADNGYLVGIITLGKATEEDALMSFHQQVLGTLRLI
ncbi:MAG: hypothetical protein JO115_01585 [Pseudonocardiales bacterium]|nr:hypothetical protein [Pseudonocardiales bacterium]